MISKIKYPLSLAGERVCDRSGDLVFLFDPAVDGELMGEFIDALNTEEPCSDEDEDDA